MFILRTRSRLRGLCGTLYGNYSYSNDKDKIYINFSQLITDDLSYC